MDALLTLSSKGQLVIPARLRQLLGLRPGDRLVLSIEPDGIRLTPQAIGKTASARELIGCSGYGGPPVQLERMDPALYAAQRRARAQKRSLSQQALADLEALAGGDPRRRRQQALERIEQRWQERPALPWPEPPEELIRADRDR